MRTGFRSLTPVFMAVLVLCSPALAQIHGPSTEGARSPEARKAAAAAPKSAYDPHDVSGVWWGRGNDVLMGNPVPSIHAAGAKESRCQ